MGSNAKFGKFLALLATLAMVVTLASSTAYAKDPVTAGSVATNSVTAGSTAADADAADSASADVDATGSAAAESEENAQNEPDKAGETTKLRLTAESEPVSSVPYVERRWEDSALVSEDKTHDAYPVPSDGRMESGWYFLDSNVTVDGRISISGDTNLILGDGKTLNVKGFYVPKGTTLTVYGQSDGPNAGRIYSHPSGGAAIGAYADHRGGDIVIHGGRIDAEGHDHCAGIGGNDGDRKDIGSITIYGGNIKAEGGNAGAGIGGGQACEGGNINIYGGVVNAWGGHYGAGIGGGNGKDTNPMRGAHGGKITIWGGEVNAWGGDDGAGIGGGEGGNAGTITINGGTVTATGGNNSSGIGTGEGESTGVGGTVTINGGTVTAKGGGDAAGIGGGEDAHCDTITINGGEVNATGGGNGAGIGAGRNAHGGTIRITGGNVTAKGKDSSAGIGGGDPSGSFADFSHIEISGGTVEATGDAKGAGIGGGEYGHASISITGGDITAVGGSSGGAGIGNGKDGSGSAILLDYTDETADTISITTRSYKGTVTLAKPFKGGADNPETFRETGSVSDLGKLADSSPLVAWTDAEIIPRDVDADSWSALQMAIDEASTDEKNIRLTADVTAGDGDTRIMIPAGKSIAIDLNGKTMDRGLLSSGQYLEDGSAIYVEGNATLTIFDGSSEKTGTITGGKATKGGGILNEGTLFLKGGSVTGNSVSRSGGGIYNEGTLTVKGGTVSGNSAAEWGGGVYLANTATPVLHLNGGEITNNACGKNGGGVHVSEAALITVSGKAEISGNKKASDNTDNNVNLADGTFINVTGALQEDARIRVHMSFPKSGSITSGLKDKGTAANFVSDDSGYEVAADGGGEAYLRPRDEGAVTKVNSWAELQNKVNAAGERDIIQLSADVINTENKDRIQVGNNGEKIITLDLAGHRLDRKRTSKNGNGHVIEVFGGSKLTIRDSEGGGIITGGFSERGGGVYVHDGATCIITGGTITGNNANDDGGGIYVRGTLKMTGGAVTRNYADDNGGGLYVAETGRIDLTGADISYNTTEDEGGGIKIYSNADSKITNCTIAYNKTNDEYGGGIFMESSGKTLSITDTMIDHNSSDDDGGGIHLKKGAIVMNGGSLSENWSKRDSGGAKIRKGTTFTANDVIINKNTADDEEGGGIKNVGTTTLTNCRISNNKAKKQGGGVFNDDDDSAGVLNLYDCTIFGNNSNKDGGGVYSDYKLTVIGGSITGNTASNRGGGIFIGGDSKNTNIGGNLVVQDNGATGEGKEILLRTGLLDVKSKLTEGTRIGITKDDDLGLGTFTTNYFVHNGAEKPSNYFFSPEGLDIELEGGEATIATSWKTLREAIAGARDGDTFELDKDYTAVATDGCLEVPKNTTITIDLHGHTLNRNQTVAPFLIEGQFYGGVPTGCVIYVQEGATLNLIDNSASGVEPGNGTITGGYSAQGGGIFVAKNATCDARNINIRDNKAYWYGAGVFSAGNLSMTYCTVSQNISSDVGGGIYGTDSSNVSLVDVTVASNTAEDDGGGMKLDGDASISYCEITGNSSGDNGGGMYVDAEGKLLSIYYTKIDNNSSSDDGAGIYFKAGQISMDFGSISGNTTANDSGGIKVMGKATFGADRVAINNNTAKSEDGGGIKNYGATTLIGCTISGNTAGKQGGGIFNDNDGSSAGDLRLDSCTIYGNSTASDGGGIYSDKKLRLLGHNVIGITAIDGENVPGNNADGRGGGIFIGKDSDETEIRDAVVVTGNEAGIGADLYLRSGQKLTLKGEIDGTNIGIIDMDSTGVFTKGYGALYSQQETPETPEAQETHPSEFFCTNPTSISADWSDESHTEATLYSAWPELQALIDKAVAGENDGLVTLDRDYRAGSNDVTLKINEGHDVTIDLNGHAINRNLASNEYLDGSVFAVHEGGKLTVKDSTAIDRGIGTGLITGGYALFGGGILIYPGGTARIEGGMIVANRVINFGGGIMNLGTLEMTGGAVISNSADGVGGGICTWEDSDLRLENATIYMNKSGDDGGGLSIKNKSKAPEIKNCTIAENSATDYGGGLHMDAKEAKLTITDTTIEKNISVDDGAGIYLNNGTIEMSNGSISGNSSANDSGGVKVTKGATFSAEGVTIDGNKALKEEGGGVKNYGTTTLKNCTINGNSASKQGGGIFNDNDGGSAGKMTLDHCTVKENKSQSDGGGIYSDKKLDIIGGEITENASQDRGGGVFIGGDSQDTGIEGAPVIKDNEASNCGSGLYLRKGRKFALTGALAEEADIRVDLEKGTGVITSGYRAENGTDDPEEYFSFATGYYLGFTKEGEVEICSDWSALKRKVENAKNGEVITLDKDYAAADSDDVIEVKNKSITIDLAGCTLNRNRKDKVGDGHVLEVFGGAALTITDSSENATGTITGGWSETGGGIYVHGNATLNLQGGKVTGNRGNTDGGGIYVVGTLNMTSGSVESNRTDGSGGGIYMCDGSTLNLEGGTVSKNEASSQGGGIMIQEGATANVKGSPVAIENRATKAGTDMYLPSRTVLNVTDALADDAMIGIAREGNGSFTSGYSRHNEQSDPTDHFVSTDGYGVYLEVGEATLGKKIYGASKYTEPFISWNNQIGNTHALNSKNWMSGISGERYLNEINMPGSHDSGMNNVDEKYDGTAQLVFSIISGIVAVLSVVALLASPFTGGASALVAGIAFSALVGTTALNIAVPTDYTSIVAAVGDGRAADMAKTQREYIDQQYNDGARQVDIRVGCRKKVYKFIGSGAFNGYTWEDDGKNLWICHGKVKAGGTYLAEDPSGEYLSFSQVLEWTKDFLQEHPTETIIFDLRPETTDSSNFPTIYKRARKILENSALQINPSTEEPYLYKEPGSDNYFAPYTHIPKLADCRGKIVLMPENDAFVERVGGFKNGSMVEDYIDELDYKNTPSEMVAQVRSVYNTVNGDGHVMLPATADTNLDRLWYWELNCTGEHSGISNYISGDPPHENADYVNPRLIGEGKTFDPNKAGQFIGWVRTDSFEAKYAEPIWRTNFFDELEDSMVKVTVKSGLNDANYPDQTYRLLKGTKIEIPGNIYKWPDNSGNAPYFDRWMVDGEIGYVPGDSFTLHEDVVFTAKWLDEGETPVQIRWKDGNDADSLRPDHLDVTVTANTPEGTQEKPVTLTGENGWRDSVKLIGDVTDVVANWSLIGEDADGRYKCVLTREDGIGYILTLIHTPNRTDSISGAINWEGDEGHEESRPAVTIHLWKNGEEADSKTVTAGDGWVYSFGELRMYENGEKITYGITGTIEGPAAERYDINVEEFSVTNTYIPEEAKTAVVMGVVEWDDASDVEGLRPGKVFVTLRAGDEELGSLEAMANGSDEWVWTSENVPVTDEEGNPINYAVTPAEVPGYDVSCEAIAPVVVDGSSDSESVSLGEEVYLFRITYTLQVDPADKSPAEIVEPPVARELTYCGEPQKLVEKGTATGGTLLYACSDSVDTCPDSSAFSKEVPKATDAGTYYVWYCVKGDALHTGIEADVANVVKVEIADYRHMEAKEATCGDEGHSEHWVVERGGESTYYGDAALEHEIVFPDDVVIPATGNHAWDGGTITKKPTEAAQGEKTYTCTVCGATKTEAVPAKGYGPGDDPNQMGVDGTPVGPGASAAAADRAITSLASDTDPAGSVFLPLRLRSTKQAKTSIKLSWSKAGGAAKYVVYGNRCGKAYKMKKLATAAGKSKTFKKVAGAKLKKGTSYKFIVVALDKSNNVVCTSKMIHVCTKGGKLTNHKSVKVQAKAGKGFKAAKKVSVKAGKTARVRGVGVKAAKRLKYKAHAKMRYESSNAAVATVSAKGVVKGVGKGTCRVWAYSQNGVGKSIKVVVK